MTSKLSSLVLVLATILLCSSSSLSAQPQRRFAEGKPFMFTPRPPFNPNQSCGQQPFRTYDGTCNNTSRPNSLEWGATEVMLLRDIPPQYGRSNPNSALGGETRPSARQVSNVLSNEPIETLSKFNLSAFTYIWGQFLDHDMALTPTGTSESVPIKLPQSETLFTVDIPFTRSTVHTGTGVTTPRQQSNLVTAWIDGSQVYGSDSSRANWLRTFRDGKLKVSAGNLLPFNTTNGEYTGTIDPNAPSMTGDNNKTTKTFVAGDVRAAEHPGLSALHTLFVREHNRICDRLKAEGQRVDEQMYQRARKEVGAIMQAITYQEFLPAMGVTVNPYRGYNAAVQPDLTNIFTTAAYRLGHTMVADDIVLKDNQCQPVGEGDLDLLDVFFNTLTLRQYNIDPILKGLSSHVQYETDLKVNDVLRNMLFGNANATTRFGLDLVALNIQRGRDHGLPDYNTARRVYTGQPARTFKEITTPDSTANRMQNLYGNVNNIDLWVGLLAEDDLPNKSFGRTLHEILRGQFERLRDGDFYFYMNDPYLPIPIRNAVNTTKLSDIIKRNSSIYSVQSNVFFTQECPEPTLALRTNNNNGSANSTISSAVNLSVAPNPATEIVTIKTQLKESTTAVLEVFDVRGRLLRSIKEVKDSQDVDVSNFKAGVYIVSLTSSEGTTAMKFVKQ